METAARYTHCRMLPDNCAPFRRYTPRADSYNTAQHVFAAGPPLLTCLHPWQTTLLNPHTRYIYAPPPPSRCLPPLSRTRALYAAAPAHAPAIGGRRMAAFARLRPLLPLRYARCYALRACRRTGDTCYIAHYVPVYIWGERLCWRTITVPIYPCARLLAPCCTTVPRAATWTRVYRHPYAFLACLQLPAYTRLPLCCPLHLYFLPHLYTATWQQYGCIHFPTSVLDAWLLCRFIPRVSNSGLLPAAP